MQRRQTSACRGKQFLEQVKLLYLLPVSLAVAACGCVTQGGAVARKEDGVQHRSRATHAKQEAQRKTNGDCDCEISEHLFRLKRDE